MRSIVTKQKRDRYAGYIVSEKGRKKFKKLLEERILVKASGLTIHENETLIFTGLQEMLKNAISKHDWSSKDKFTMEARANGGKQVILRVTNRPKKENNNKLMNYSRSLVHDEPFENEGFGNLWLKTINRLLKSKFKVSPEWLIEDAKDYPDKFWLEIIITDKA